VNYPRADIEQTPYESLGVTGQVVTELTETSLEFVVLGLIT